MSPTPLAANPLVAAFATTLLVTVFSYLAPPDLAATLVGATFLGAGYWFVLRHDAATIRRHGLAFGGIFEPGPLPVAEMARSLTQAMAWCAACSLLCFPAFLLGYQLWFQPQAKLTFAPGAEPWNEALGQVFAIALPEELFYRGYLQSALDQAFPPRFRLAGAQIGYGLLLSSAIFALGHLLTTPNPARLAVFFPSLLFGWLRARTGGIGASVLFHASCNLFSAYLARGYGFID